MRLDRTITLGCIACGGLAMNNTVPLCQICHEDVRAGGDSAIERIHAIAQLQREEREYNGDSRVTALEQKIATLESYIEAGKTEKWKRGVITQ